MTVWIASYPRSGNTWLRFLLYHYWWGPVARSIDVNRRIPDVHFPGRIDRAHTSRYWKTHHVVEQLPADHVTDAAIYVQRHPRDVMASAVDYHRLRSGCGVEEQLTFARRFIDAGGAPAGVRLGFGTWAEHLDAWRTEREFPVHVLSYEALSATTGAELQRVLAFLGEDVDTTRIEAAVTGSSFAAMRRLEEREKEAHVESLFPAGGGSESARFMNVGRVGRELPAWGAGLERAFETRFGSDLRRFGYS